MSNSLENNTFLVTGASSGIGNQCAIDISNRQGTVILSSRNIEALETTRKKLKGDQHQIIAADLSSDDEVNKLVEMCPNLSGIVHCAGTVDPFPIKMLTKETLEDTFKINLISPILLTSKIIRQKKIDDKASIVFISSLSSHYPAIGLSAYASSNASLEAFSKVLALEMAHKEIRSNVVAPGLVKTNFVENAKKYLSEEDIFKEEKRYPLGLGKPEYISNAVIFLLSDQAKWMTGQTIYLDGGFSLNSKPTDK